jgi:hypothetical protein
MRALILGAIFAALTASCGRGIDKQRPAPVVISNNTVANYTTANNTTANNTTANNTTTTTANNITGIDPAIVAVCANYCEVFVGRCVVSDCRLGPNGEQDREDAHVACMGDGDPTLACTTIYQNNPAFRAEVDGLADATCADQPAIDLRCDLYSTSCGACPAPVLGTACTSDSDCDAGPLMPSCFEQQPDGRYPGGQCLASGCEVPADASEGQLYFGGATGCGQEGACFVGPGLNTFCLATCTQNSDCHRAVTGANDIGYACNIVGTTSVLGPSRPTGFCEGACVTDADCSQATPVCGSNRACRDECETNGDCPSGLTCSGLSASGLKTCELP